MWLRSKSLHCHRTCTDNYGLITSPHYEEYWITCEEHRIACLNECSSTLWSLCQWVLSDLYRKLVPPGWTISLRLQMALELACISVSFSLQYSTGSASSSRHTCLSPTRIASSGFTATGESTCSHRRGSAIFWMVAGHTKSFSLSVIWHRCGTVDSFSQNIIPLQSWQNNLKI